MNSAWLWGRAVSKACLLVGVLMLAAACTSNATDIIQTIAGGGSLEGYKPVEANLSLGAYKGVAVNAAGELFVADTGHHQVLKINPATGLITVVAGNGTNCFYGDGLPGPSAALSFPQAIALDSAGNLFIADAGNSRIRKVDTTTGFITTVAGTGTPGLSGDGGLATSAQLTSPGDVAVDSAGNIFIGDSGNNLRVREVFAGTNIIQTVAGSAPVAARRRISAQSNSYSE